MRDQFLAGARVVVGAVADERVGAAWDEDADALVVACGAEIGRRRRGGPAMIRTLFRDGEPGTLPVL